MHLVPLRPVRTVPRERGGSAGWRALAARVDAERARARAGRVRRSGAATRSRAELAYYLPGRPRTWSAEIAGDHGLAVPLWFDPAELAGREGILVLDPREKRHLRRDAPRRARPLERIAAARR